LRGGSEPHFGQDDGPVQAADWSDELNPAEKLRQKHLAIPKLRDFFNHLKPLPHFGGNGKKSPNVRWLASQGYDPECDGLMIYSRALGSKDESEDGRMLQIHESADRAFRMTGHAKETYQDELRFLFSAEMYIESLQAQLTEVRKTDPDYEERKEDLKSKMAAVAERFKKTTNFHKQSACKVMLSKIDFKDSKGAKTWAPPAPSGSKPSGCSSRACPRCRNRSRYIDVDRQTLLQLISESESLLNLHFHEWKRIVERLGKLENAAVFNGSPEENLGNQRENFIKSLFSTLETQRPLSTLQPVRPFLPFAQLLAHLKAKVETAVRNRDRATALSETKNAIALGDLFKANRSIEDLLRDIALDSAPNPKSLDEKAKLLSDILSNSQTFVEGSPFSTMRNLILTSMAEFRKPLEEIQNSNPSPELLPKLLAPLKEKLEAIDFNFCLGAWISRLLRHNLRTISTMIQAKSETARPSKACVIVCFALAFPSSPSTMYW